MCVDTTGSGGVPHEGELSSVRAYLALVRSMEFTIDAEMSNFLENELVEARKQDKDLDPSAMHSWLTVKPSGQILSLPMHTLLRHAKAKGT